MCSNNIPNESDTAVSQSDLLPTIPISCRNEQIKQLTYTLQYTTCVVACCAHIEEYDDANHDCLAVTPECILEQ